MISKMIEPSQTMIGEQHNNNPCVSEYFELEIKTLQNAPRRERDGDKLEVLLKAKE
jgi:hypothetical protein